MQVYNLFSLRMGLHFLLGAGPCHAPLVFHSEARVAENPGMSALKGPCRSSSSQWFLIFFCLLSEGPWNLH